MRHIDVTAPVNLPIDFGNDVSSKGDASHLLTLALRQKMTSPSLVLLNWEVASSKLRYGRQTATGHDTTYRTIADIDAATACERVRGTFVYLMPAFRSI